MFYSIGLYKIMLQCIVIIIGSEYMIKKLDDELHIIHRKVHHIFKILSREDMSCLNK